MFLKLFSFYARWTNSGLFFFFFTFPAASIPNGSHGLVSSLFILKPFQLKTSDTAGLFLGQMEENLNRIVHAYMLIQKLYFKH